MALAVFFLEDRLVRGVLAHHVAAAALDAAVLVDDRFLDVVEVELVPVLDRGNRHALKGLQVGVTLLVHEVAQARAHVLHDLEAVDHGGGADLHGAATHRDELGRVAPGADAADAARFAAVLQVEVIVAPALELRMPVGPEGGERFAAGGVEMHAVFFEAVVGRQVHAAAKPGHGRCVLRQGGEHPHIHVHRGHEGVVRVDDQRHAHGLERRAGQLRAVLRGRGRQHTALHMREVDTPPLDDGTALDEP